MSRKPGLAGREQALLRRATEVARASYSPYSRFPVGAAVRVASGAVFTGANVENASYGLTVCAERVAVFKAASAGHRRLREVAVVAGKGEPAAPCGACLQVLAEFAGPELAILLASRGPRPRVRRCTLGELLPRAFRLAGGRTP